MNNYIINNILYLNFNYSQKFEIVRLKNCNVKKKEGRFLTSTLKITLKNKKKIVKKMLTVKYFLDNHRYYT